jgi:signal transduction histidine kinase/CheY-like chemotaxis protein
VSRVTNPFRKLQVSFKAKVFALTLSFVVSLSLLFPAIFIPYEIRDNTASLLKEGTLLCNLLAYSARIAVYSETPALLDGAADGILAHTNVQAVTMYAADGRKIFEERMNEDHTQEHHVPLVDTPEERRAMAALAGSLTQVTHKATSFGIEFTAPVRMISGMDPDDTAYWGIQESRPPEQSIGLVRIQLHDKDIRETIRILVTISVGLALICIMVGSVIAYLISRSVTGPLKRLSTMVTALGVEGRLTEVPVETDDEVGQVAMAFNGLIDSLRSRESEKAFLEEQLRHSQKLEAVGTLAGGIAHDFNTILTAIIGFADLLLKEAGDLPEVRQYVGQIRNSAGKASQLITRLLAFSRKQVLNPRTVDLNDVVRGMEQILRRVMTDAVTLDLALDPDPIPVLVDADQFDQVLLNLAANARDAMPDGGSLRISTRRAPACEAPCGGDDHSRSGWCAVVTVTDSGQGVPDDIREKIFDPFFTTKEVGKGTGLGLSMAYGIIRQHSGTIVAQGEEGVGTTFTICLPCLNPCLLGGEITGIEGLRVVVADTDPVMRFHAGQVLRECGATVHEAEESIASVRLCSDPAEPVDVVLLNILMPGAKDAYEDIRRVFPEIRFIFIGGIRRTGMAQDDAMDVGIATVYRPLDGEELLAKLVKVLGREATGNRSV